MLPSDVAFVGLHLDHPNLYIGWFHKYSMKQNWFQAYLIRITLEWTRFIDEREDLT